MVRKFAAYTPQRFPPHLQYVATLSCEIRKSVHPCQSYYQTSSGLVFFETQCSVDYVWRCGRVSESWQAVERTVCRVEAEREYRSVILVADIHASSARERPQLAHVADRHRHVALCAADREVVLVSVLPRLPGKIELDAGKRKLERDAPVVDRALSLDRKRRRRHRHPQVHRREPAVRRRRTAARRRHTVVQASTQPTQDRPSLAVFS